ncbi:TetR/AcrR family transcriptional regulator [Leptospira sp. GIMC2001]|uniref:TetR/AcrR family transcriptional regulator n=1 Tax=Leptospira sp. GIMC2001 TaxID=1513297 RepID=UPI00234A6D28|nr:TetR/AcrR family transcriptional regulator [Leptospira sp. GIMC2001]WCL50054.1 TetR/AcrR family transcriptional regulator [Leptospira sp. GIMC2001]
MKPSPLISKKSQKSNRLLSTKKTNSKSNSSPKVRILIKASDLFYHQGYNATGINQIIQESLTAKASFYDHFPSKENLGKEVIRRYAIQILIWFRALLRKSSTPEIFLDNLEKSVIQQTKSKISIYQGCPIALLSAQFPREDGNFADQFRGAVLNWEKLFNQFFIKMKNRRLLPSSFDSKSVTRSWINIYEGALITWRMSGDKEFIYSMKKSMLDVYQSAINKSILTKIS